MQVSKEEILHIAKLANLNLKEEEVTTYMGHLEEILNFANIVNEAPIEGLKETIGANETYNVFRKDELKQGINREELLQNAKEVQEGMFKIPKVIN
ncbi:MAG: Asp-tRNA(Asn)/Glu-tRNA(Gln) amidotransferase subunit GatC [Clostridia bacterium]|nr:Asp-tRNA(Asn)/Glu-tRNA(Gln) amidotransferase subunit GatC [Clostridia bacterium]